MFIFHKTEIQTVILRCLMSLNLNWYKSYDTKRKNWKNTNLCFWTKLQKNQNGNISVLSHNSWTNQHLLEFRPVKQVIMTVWTSVLWKMNIHISKKWPELVVTRSFIKGHSFPISLYDNLVIINPPFLRPFCVLHFIGNRSFELIFSNFDVIQQRWRGLLFGFWNVARYEKILWVIGGPPLSAMLYWLKLLKYW